MELIDIIMYSLAGALVLAIIIGLGIANSAGTNLIRTYREYEKRIVDYTNPFAFAQQVSQGEFNGTIRCDVCKGFLTDHYYRGTISLSEQTVKTSSISSMSVVAHELGHAVQYRDEPAKMAKFNKKRRTSRLLGKFTVPLFLIGLVCMVISLLEENQILTIASIVVMAGALVMFVFGLSVQISTIKIEKEASENALVLLERYAYLDEYQIKLARKVLASAKLTYIAQFLKSVLSWTMLVKKYDFY